MTQDQIRVATSVILRKQFSSSLEFHDALVNLCIRIDHEARLEIVQRFIPQVIKPHAPVPPHRSG